MPAQTSAAGLTSTRRLRLLTDPSLVGAPGVAAVSRLVRSILFGIAPQDPLTL
ncbi:MAG: hypothetical protein ABIS29_18930 [Vicinamibacterales bacterium]